jgi:hypothetical protein
MFTSYASAPRINEAGGKLNDGAVYYLYDDSGTLIGKGFTRVITHNRYRKVGMTKAAADSGVTAIFDTNVTAEARRMDQFGHWEVAVDCMTRTTMDTRAI